MVRKTGQARAALIARIWASRRPLSCQVRMPVRPTFIAPAAKLRMRMPVGVRPKMDSAMRAWMATSGD